jgi:cyclohexadienyl dehydratase
MNRRGIGGTLALSGIAAALAASPANAQQAAPSRLQANQYDAVFTGTSMSVARAVAEASTIPSECDTIVPLATRQTASRFRNRADLNRRGVTIGTNLGTTMEQFVQQGLPNATLRRVENPARDCRGLLTGRVAAPLSSLIEAAFLARAYRQRVPILGEKPRNRLPMAFLVAAGDLTCLTFLKAWVTIRQASGFFDAFTLRPGIVQA